MKLSKLIRELSVARDKLKVDPEVEIKSHDGEDSLSLGTIKFVLVSQSRQEIRLII